MNTKSAAVTGARHARAGRNGQDAAASWSSARSRGPGPAAAGSPVAAVSPVPELAAAVVCDGCSAGSSAEVGARLGAQLMLRALVSALEAGGSPADPAFWVAVRGRVVAALRSLVADAGDSLGGSSDRDRASFIHDCLLFTVVAAAATRDVSAVWAIGDGAYSFGDRTRVLGPFADNAPPYLAYDLLGDPADAHLEVIAPSDARGDIRQEPPPIRREPPPPIVIATDGALDLGGALERFACERFVTHPDALRRELALRARGSERIRWDERRIERTPAELQDDCAIGVIWR